MIINRGSDNCPNIRKIHGCQVVIQFIYLGALITNPRNCKPEIRRRMQLARSAMTSLTVPSRFQQINGATKANLVRLLVFSLALYGSETWTLRTADRRRLDAFQMWCWRRLRIPWKAHRTKVSVLQEIQPPHRLSSLNRAAYQLRSSHANDRK